MTLLVVGVSHRSAPMSVLEGAGVDAEGVPKILLELLRRETISEALVLSTCNRVEVYASAPRFHAAVTDVSEVLAENMARGGGDATASDLASCLTVHWDAAAAEHLFRVAAGLESMAVGEGQILGQLRTAYDIARTEGAVGRELHDAVQQALRVGKLVQTETAIGRAGVSLVSVGLGLAGEVLGGLAGRRALVVGAGTMGALAASTLRLADVAEVAASSRGGESARRLTSSLCGMAVPPQDVAGLLARYDVVVTATGGTEPVITRSDALGPVLSREGRPLVVVDLGLPHDVEADVGSLPGVRLFDLEEIRRRLAREPVGDEVAAASALVAEELEAFLATQRALAAVPVVAALRSRAEEVVDSELRRLVARVDVDEATWSEVQRTVRRVVDKLLHSPSVRVREKAAEPGGLDYAQVVRDLFQLEPGVTDSLTRPRGPGTRSAPR